MTRILWLATLGAYGLAGWGWWILIQILHTHVSFSAI